MTVRHEAVFPEDQQPTPPPISGEGVLNGVHLSAVEALSDEELARQREQQRQLMLHDFYEYAKEKHDIDPRTTDASEEHDLALVVHGFAWSRVSGRIQKEQALATEDASYTPSDIRLLDAGRMIDRINRRYSALGKPRQYMTRAERLEEETFLTSAKKRATAFMFDRDAPIGPTAEGSALQSGKGVPRFVRYPEIGLAMELREALIDDKSFVAAKGAEITFASYGSLFPANVRERPIHLVNDTGIVRRLIKTTWDESELPEDELADRIQPRKKLSKERQADATAEIEEQE